MKTIYSASIAIVVLVLAPATTSATASATSWPTYLGGLGRSGYNAAERTISPATAPRLSLQWTLQTGAQSAIQPLLADGRIYWGDSNGFEHAATLAGRPVWKQNLGVSTSSCFSVPFGVGDAGTLTGLTIGSKLIQSLVVGGGDGRVYALNRQTGAVMWRRDVGGYLWSAPLVYHGSVYIGRSAILDCPLIQGQVIQLDASTGKITHRFGIVPTGCTGGSVWGSVTIDPNLGRLYVATGNAGECAENEPQAEAVVGLRTADLGLLGSWRIPAADQVSDGDFGSTPTLFTRSVGKTTQDLVGVAAKNGVYYAFRRTAISSGPVWQTRIARPGDCPTCGDGSIAPSSWDGQRLYVAGGATTINGQSCQGSVRALNPASGLPIWEACIAYGPILAAVTAAPGVVEVGSSSHIVILDSRTGAVLLDHDTGSGAPIYSPASIVGGRLYQLDLLGNLYAFGVESTRR